MAGASGSHFTVRRFRCGNVGCPRVIFAERFGDDIVSPYARRTARLQTIVHHLGLALGGRPGQGLARRLLMPVSKDTLLRTVRARAPEARPASRVIGIDDWAWKRGHRYGSIVCDLERREIVDLLPDREAATVETWLAANSGGAAPRWLGGEPQEGQAVDARARVESRASPPLRRHNRQRP